MMDMHNHTNWSGDAVHEPEQIIENAIKNGIQQVGITDHHRSVLKGCEDYNNLSRYIDCLNCLKDTYKNQIKVMAGIEINVNFHLGEEETIPYSMLNSLDYVLFEHVDGGELYGARHTEYCLHFSDLWRVREKISCAAGLAHTDLIGRSKIYRDNQEIEFGMEAVIKMMQDNCLFWEINTSYHDYYLDNTKTTSTELSKQMLFDKLKQKGIKVSSGSDTHYLDDYDIARLTKANKLATSIGNRPF